MRNRYILMRHGETKYQAKGFNVLYFKEEQSSLSITNKAKKVIKQRAKGLRSEGIDLIYASDYYRTRQTAKIVQKELEVLVFLDKRLRDTDFGIFSGRPDIEYKEYFSSKLQRFSKRVPRGESWRDIKKRIISFIKDIDKKHKNKTILIISHADTLWLLASYLKGLTEKESLNKRSSKQLLPDVAQIIKI